MNLKKNKIFIIVFLGLIILLFSGIKVNAASANITVEPSTVELGKTVKITVSGKGVQWNLKLKVDGEVLKTDSELENYEANKNISFSANYTPKTVGTKKVTLEGSVTEFSDGSTIKSFNGKEIKVDEKKQETTINKDTGGSDNDTTNKKTVTDNEPVIIEQPKEKSNNAYLKTLGVRISDSLAKELGVKTNEYDFSGFNKNKTSYNVTVPKNVDSLKIVATAGENGTVKVTGNTGFEVGSNNNIKINVTSENGKTTKTYTIKVTQLAEEEEKPGNIIENEKNLCLTSLKIEGIELVPEFASSTYSYTAMIPSDKTEVVVDAVPNNENAKVEISGNKNLTEGENTINILITLDDSDEQIVYQIVVTKEEAPITMIPNDQENNSAPTTDFIGSIKKYIWIAIAVFAFIIITIIVLIILLKKENKKLKEEDEQYEESQTNDNEYNEYKNNEDEFENNNIKKDNFIESLYKQRNGMIDDEELTEDEKQTLEEINKQTEEIFAEKVKGQSIEYSDTNQYNEENPLEIRRKRRGKGRHSI